MKVGLAIGSMIGMVFEGIKQEVGTTQGMFWGHTPN